MASPARLKRQVSFGKDERPQVTCVNCGPLERDLFSKTQLSVYKRVKRCRRCVDPIMADLFAAALRANAVADVDFEVSSPDVGNGYVVDGPSWQQSFEDLRVLQSHLERKVARAQGSALERKEFLQKAVVAASEASSDGSPPRAFPFPRKDIDPDSPERATIDQLRGIADHYGSQTRELEQATAELMQVTGSMGPLQAEIDQVQAEYRAEVDALRRESAAVMAMLEAARASKNELEVNFTQRLDKSESERQELVGQVEFLTEQVQRAQQDAAKSQAHLEACLDRTKALESRKQSADAKARHQMDECERELTQLMQTEAAVEARDAIIAELRATVASLQRQTKRSEAEEQRLTQKLAVEVSHRRDFHEQVQVLIGQMTPPTSPVKRRTPGTPGTPGTPA